MQQLHPSIPQLPPRKSYVSNKLPTCTMFPFNTMPFGNHFNHLMIVPTLRSSADKHFIIDIHDREDTVSLDHFKPGYLQKYRQIHHSLHQHHLICCTDQCLHPCHHYHHSKPAPGVTFTGQTFSTSTFPETLRGEWCSGLSHIMHFEP